MHFHSGRESAGSMEIGTGFAIECILTGMEENYRHQEAHYANLHSAYRAEWRNLSGKVSQWRFLLQEVHADAVSISVAEAATRLAEEHYRQARNALAEYMLEQHSGKLRPTSKEGVMYTRPDVPLASPAE